MDKRAWAVGQLRERYAALGRLPKKNDFDEKTMARIKGILGPWPRALEAAGLKEAPQRAAKHTGTRGKRAAMGGSISRNQEGKKEEEER